MRDEEVLLSNMKKLQLSAQSPSPSPPEKSLHVSPPKCATPPKKKNYFSKEDKFFCELCKAQYTRFGNLLNHLSDKHKDIDITEELTCAACKKVFENYVKLNRHMKTVHVLKK